MTDPLFLAAVFFAGLYLGAWQAIRHCADATLRFDRDAWWRKALKRAEQRREYAQFCREVERRQPEVEVEFHRDEQCGN